ncbi:hypothetical protein [Moorena sp. SIO3A2]|nr:hypothetical protein [Moorena sp. SIO3A2]NEQ17819.1 hypothetical protein [Moorena sp. SIO3E2]NET64731.1 hypothetical protein [Moorena sp. SIO1G6]
MIGHWLIAMFLTVLLREDIALRASQKLEVRSQKSAITYVSEFRNVLTVAHSAISGNPPPDSH